MPYSNTASFLSAQGGAFPQVTARLWMLWNVVGSGSGTGAQQIEQESLRLHAAGSFAVNFNLGPNNDAVSRAIGLSLQDTNLVASDRGWWFRSGRFEHDLPTDAIEVVLGGETLIPAADLPGLLPTPPFAVDADTTVTALTATLAAGGIDFTATGTTTKTGVVVGFRYAGQIRLLPSPDIANAAAEALTVGVATPTIVFLPGPSVISPIEAELLNLLRVFILRDIADPLRRGLERRVNAAVLSAFGRSLAGGALPAGVILSVRSIVVGPADIRVLGALGAFGGVFSKLPAASTGRCFIATAAFGGDSDEVRILRAWRDHHLHGSVWGRKFVAAYERVSPPAAEVISAHPFLKAVARMLLVRPAAFLAKWVSGRSRNM